MARLEAADERSDAAPEPLEGTEHSESLRSGRENSALAPTVLGSSDPAFEIRDGGRHLRVSRKGYAPALDLDGSHTAKPGDKQRVPLPGHFLKVIWLGFGDNSFY